MSTGEIVHVETARSVYELTAAAEALDAAGREYARDSRAASTWRAYQSDWRIFTAWCAQYGESSMPTSSTTVRRFITACAGNRKVSTIDRYLAAISVHHKLAKFDDPTRTEEVKIVRKGIRRVHGAAIDKKTAATTGVIMRLIEPIDTSKTVGVRDRAILLLGFAAALRRSEVAALDVHHITVDDKGLQVLIARSKTDQEGKGETVGVEPGDRSATCPVQAWIAWERALRSVGKASGPVFRGVTRSGKIGSDRISPQSIALVVKRRALAAGLDPDEFAAHSLRSGFATTASRAGVAETKIMRHGRWRSSDVMRGYIAEGELFDDNPTAKLGL